MLSHLDGVTKCLFFNNSVCVCVCVSACVMYANMCAQVFIFMYTHGSKKRKWSWVCCLFYQSPPYYFETGSLTKPETRLAVLKLL